MHFLLFPFMAQGHTIPMLDIARMLAQHGVLVTLITTPLNANRIRQTLHPADQINLIEVKFPSEEAGLPPDCENLDALASLGSAMELCFATNLLQKPVETLLQEMKPRPNCIISDMNLPYTSRVAANLHLPRISFNGFCAFTMLCDHRVHSSGILQSVKSESEYFTVPGLPLPIQISKQQLPKATARNNDAFFAEVAAAEKETYGLIINTFEELESEYIQQYRTIQDKVWCIGPVSQSNKHTMDVVQRGDDSLTQCLKWLDKQKPGSVIYVCFGSLCNLVTLQLIELALGLEASKRPFIWVIRGGGRSGELEQWMNKENFEERTKGRSLLIRGWAPQVAILSHVAIGGFLTHCGWNSTLEAISVGVPMVTWPLFADQFCNEKLVVDVLKIGVKVGVEAMVVWGEEEKIGVMVKNKDIAKAVIKVMEEGEEGEEMRKRVKELSVKAKRAMEPNGSSLVNLKQLIEDIKLLQARTKQV